MTDPTLLRLEAVSKSFTNHLRGAVHLPVVERVGLTVARGEIAILGGPSGVGKVVRTASEAGRRTSVRSTVAPRLCPLRVEM